MKSPTLRSLRYVPLFAAAIAAATLPGVADAAGKSAASAEPEADAGPEAAASEPLPELPRLAPIAHPEPDPAVVAEVTSLLDRLTSSDARTRENARGRFDDLDPEAAYAIRAKLLELRATLDRGAAMTLLEKARKEARKRKKASKGDEEEEDDWLEFMLAVPEPESRVWGDLVRLYAMERMLAAIATTPAVREMIATYAYFGDLVRVDLQRHVGKLKDHAVPALIEARQHDAKMVQRWASRQLDDLGRAIPGEAVASNDTQVLADVLRAYGYTRDVDAVRVVLSFCDSDRARLREASREAVAAIGEPGLWQLRDAYLGLTGEKPPRSFTWDRIARELFALYDRARLAEVHKLMDDGLVAAKAGKTAEAIEAFDRVLARVPLYPRRKEMVPAYVARAKDIESESRADALEILRKALRLDPKGAEATKLEAEIAYLEGMWLIEQGTPDKFILARAVELDPTHERAREALASLEDKAIARQESMQRYVIAGGVGVAALLAMLLIARRPRKLEGATEPPPAES